MAISDVQICNFALQKLGASRITSLTEDSREARSCNANYEVVRNAEMRRHVWNFAKARDSLSASATAPAFGFARAFPLPTDFLRLILPPTASLDWTIERHQGRRAILTNDTAPLYIRYIALVTDPTEFDPLFVNAFACKLAWQMCEELTQSNTKKSDITQEYIAELRDAKRLNAFENVPVDSVTDPWDLAREVGNSRPDLGFGV